MSQRNRRIVTFAVMMGTALAALDVTVVSAAMPTIIGHLGSLSLYPWVFSAYLLTSTITMPLYGKLSDIYGRKRMFALGAAIFLIGSALCGTATSMPLLILYRALQGLGAGGVQPMTMTIIGDIYSMEERGRIQGLFSSVWSISSIVGPAVGGLMTQYLSWRGIFYMNLPFGLISIVLLLNYLDEKLEPRRVRIDYLGAGLLCIGVTALLLAILEGGTDFPWDSLPILALFGVAAFCAGLFLWQEFRAPEPILPPPLFRRRIISVSVLGSVLLGAEIVALPSYLPLYVQGVLGGTALIAGIAVAPLSVLWPAGSYLCGRLVLRVGYRVSALAGVVSSILGMALLLPLGWLPLGTTAQGACILLGTGLAGFGMGTLSLTYLIAIQNSVPWNQRGVATASSQFARSIGGAVGVSAMGAVLNAQLASQLLAKGINLSSIADPGQPGHSLTVSSLLRPETRAALPADLVARLVGPLGDALHLVFLIIVAVTVSGLLAAWWLPGGKVRPQAASGDEPADAPVEAGALAAERVV
jgi:EmrB/QacA subfamily drug resistance transporter